MVKWQAKAATEPKAGAVSSGPKPTLIPKKESRRAEVTRDDDTALLHCRMHFFPDSESDEDASLPRHIMYSASQDGDSEMSSSTDVPLPSPVPLPEPDPSFPAPEHYEDLTAEVASFVASLALPCGHNWKTLNSAPFQIIARGPLLTSIVFDDGRSRVMDTAAVDAYIRVTTQTPAPPLQPPPPPQLPPLLQLSPTPVVTRHQSRTPSPLLSPALSPAFTWQPSWQPARPPTPYHEPASPPTPLTTYSPHRDITYQHDGASVDVNQSSSAPAPFAKWRQAQAEEAARPILPTPWTVFKWGTTEDTNQEPEPWNNSRRSSSNSSSHSSPHSYAHTRSAHRPPASPASPPRSSFRSGTTGIATASARDPSNPDPVAFVPILVGLDSYSDITVAAPELIYNKRKITESVSTGAGASDYFEEGFIDIADGLYSFRTLPALVASSPHHLPSSCVGVPQLNEVDIRVDVHRKQRKLPLSSYDPSIILAADSPLECRLLERDLDKWATHNSSKPVGSVPYSYLDVDINPA